MTDIVKQYPEKNEPAFNEIDWEKPVNKKQAGSLLVVGGSPHGFAVVGNSYEYALRAGAGTVHVVMPSATKSFVADIFGNISFLPSTISGSFSKKGLSELKVLSSDSWATLLAGDFGRNSETALLVEGFLISTTGKVILSKDAIDFASASYPRPVLNREDTVLVASLSQLQKLLQAAGVQDNLRFAMTIDQIAEFLFRISKQYKASIVTVHHQQVFVAVDGQISMTPLGFEEGLWQTRVAAFVSVAWMQHENKPFKAITHAVYEALKN